MMSTYHRVAVDNDQKVIGFILVFSNCSVYDSENYKWFMDHFNKPVEDTEAMPEMFVYVDRIVIGEQFRGKGVGKALYNDLF